MKTYVGTFLIALATLALEIAMTRLLSVVTWYYLAFFAVSSAMLGMTAAATYVYLKPHTYGSTDLDLRLHGACLGFALSVPLSLILLCTVPLSLITPLLTMSGMLAVTLACALPFFFSGIALTVVLTKYPLPVTRVYASDLMGAATGCLFVLVGLEYFDVPSLILMCGAVGALAGVVFAWGVLPRRSHRLGVLVLVLLGGGGLANSTTTSGIQPVIVKGRREVPGDYLTIRWNSFSRVAVSTRREGGPHYWGPSPNAPTDLRVRYHYIDIDGSALTPLGEFATEDDLAHLPYDVTNIAYRLRPSGGAAIIGVGGGRDVQAALLFGHRRVTGIEVNPNVVRLLQEDFLDFANIGDREGVTLVVDDARSYLARSTDRFEIIQMSMIDTWASTGAGGFSLSENGLYTVEAWKIYLEHLSETGVFTVSRWHDPTELGETGRVISLAVAALFEVGVSRPVDHIALITTDRLSTLIVGRSPFGDEDIETLERVSEELGFVTTILPGNPVEHPSLRQLVSAGSPELLAEAAGRIRLNVSPPTDNNPYFFNMLRLREVREFWGILFRWDTLPGGVIRGNLVATVVLAGLILSLAVLAMITIFVPLMVNSRKGSSSGESPIVWSAAAYFSLIGAGFMLVEIGLIQWLSVFLGHPIYALGILLFTIILSAGIGSLLSEPLPLARTPWIYVYPATTALLIAGIAVVFPVVASRMVAFPLSSKIAVTVVMIFPLGVSLGVFFPTGMRLVGRIATAETPWYWALNGVFGLLASAVAVLVSIEFGISSTIFLGSTCYALTVLALWRLSVAGGREDARHHQRQYSD